MYMHVYMYIHIHVHISQCMYIIPDSCVSIKKVHSSVTSVFKHLSVLTVYKQYMYYVWFTLSNENT